MKMKKGLLSVAALLATSSVMAAMSFSSAEIESDMNVSVKKSDAALLALIPNTAHKAAGLNSDGELEIDLDKGKDGAQFGVQNDSVYTWDKLFTVQNNSENTVEVTVDIDGDGVDKLSANSASANSQAQGKWDPKPQPKPPVSSETLEIEVGEETDDVTFTLAPGAQKDINLIVNTDDQKTGYEFDYDIIVSAEAE